MAYRKTHLGLSVYNGRFWGSTLKKDEPDLQRVVETEHSTTQGSQKKSQSGTLPDDEGKKLDDQSEE